MDDVFIKVHQFWAGNINEATYVHSIHKLLTKYVFHPDVIGIILKTVLSKHNSNNCCPWKSLPLLRLRPVLGLKLSGSCLHCSSILANSLPLSL